MLHIQLMHFLDDRSYHYGVNGRTVVQKLPYEVSYQDVSRVGVLWRHFRLTASAILSSTQCRFEEEEEGGRGCRYNLSGCVCVCVCVCMYVMYVT